MIHHLSASAPSGDQRIKPVTITNRTSEPLTSPVTADELGAYLGLPVPVAPTDAALLNRLLLAACEYYVRLSGCELLSRDYTYATSRTPERREGLTGVAPMASGAVWWIELPLVPVAALTSVKVDGELTTDYQADLSHVPARIDLRAQGAVEIAYTAGYATAAEIPATVTTGILMLAAYLYEHRGACSVGDAAEQSGAAAMFGVTAQVLSL